jgi:alpha-beta hydrolase superfamily lysophospholipase
MMIAEKEFITCNDASKAFFKTSGSEVKQLIEFKDAYHELQKEPNKEDVYAKVLQFIGS